jgi:hypothetical protein
MRHLHKFHLIDRLKVRNSLEIERETIKLYEYFGIYSIDHAEFLGGYFRIFTANTRGVLSYLIFPSYTSEINIGGWN